MTNNAQPDVINVGTESELLEDFSWIDQSENPHPLPTVTTMRVVAFTWIGLYLLPAIGDIRSGCSWSVHTVLLFFRLCLLDLPLYNPPWAGGWCHRVPPGVMELPREWCVLEERTPLWTDMTAEQCVSAAQIATRTIGFMMWINLLGFVCLQNFRWEIRMLDLSLVTYILTGHRVLFVRWRWLGLSTPHSGYLEAIP